MKNSFLNHMAEMQAPAAAEAAGYDAFAPGAGPRLLVIDDQAMNRRVLELQLERLGLAPVLAESGAEALAILAEESFDILITDCFMPEMDGLELTRRLRALEDAGRSRSVVIALTANAVKGCADDCYAAGADDYLVKPLLLGTLAERLHHWHGALARSADDHATEREEEASGDLAGESPIVFERLGEILGDNSWELLSKVAEDFADAWEMSLSTLQDTLHRKDSSALTEAAHAAKGLARYGAAPRLTAGCEELEQQARKLDWPQATATLAALELESEKLANYVKTGWKRP